MHGYHQVVHIEIRLIIFFVAKDGEAVQSAKTGPGANCGSDYQHLIAKFRLKLNKLWKTTRPFRYDLNKIPFEFASVMSNCLPPHGLSPPGFSDHVILQARTLTRVGCISFSRRIHSGGDE